MHQGSKWRRRGAAAAYLRDQHGLDYTAEYLARLASTGGGPVFRYLNGHWPIYADDDLDEWAKSRIGPPMRKASEAPAAAHAA